MGTIDVYLRQHPIFEGLSEQQLKQITAHASSVTFHAGQKIFAENSDADKFYILRSGKVALEIPRPFHEGRFELQLLGEGDVLGWSWFIEPFKWHFDARAKEMTRAIAFDANELKQLCESDMALGFEFTKRFSKLMLQRLNATRFRLVELATKRP
ncbi:MAG: cyclic nucleotide-binding domain-containing protein [Deferribacteres bacterium]|nr:cyclic nucleotide-binding domain-containing protein [candidate division KSB1 bacterium]MCB9511478.1 cyclic nucleotide-binding domain-containing protein [Deferribacteres bacterium]